MYKLKSLLFFLLVSMGTIFKTGYVYSDTHYDINHFNCFDHQWTKDKENLYLKVKLAKGLEFDTRYYTYTIKNGLGFEINLILSEECEVLSSEGYPLQTVIFHMQLKNTDNLEKVLYTLILEETYKGLDKEEKAVSFTQQTKEEGQLNTPAINLTQAPQFITNDESNYGAIILKNSLPATL